MPRTLVHPNIAPRGLSRDEAAIYVGVRPTLFDRQVRDGKMPKPLHIGGRRVWDIRQLDVAMDKLAAAPTDASKPADPWSVFRA
jgi:hypothetical protein